MVRLLLRVTSRAGSQLLFETELADRESVAPGNQFRGLAQVDGDLVAQESLGDQFVRMQPIELASLEPWEIVPRFPGWTLISHD